VYQPKGNRLLSRREAALALGISVDTLARLLDRSELRAVRVGRSVLVPTSEVESFVNRRLATAAGTGEEEVAGIPGGDDEGRS
jgi:excisionase family DNA binding protein